MTDPMQHQLLGHLLGALDDEEQQSVDARLESDPNYCREFIDWRRRLAPLESLRPDFEPPADLARRTCRHVAAYVQQTAVSSEDAKLPRMSQRPLPPLRSSSVGWPDSIVLGLLLVAAVGLILPAIDGSRFQSRLASCQDSLRQFGTAMTQYGRQKGRDLGWLADSGRLTREGAKAVGLLEEGWLTDDRRPLCSDAWLAVQGVVRTSLHGGTRSENMSSPLDLQRQGGNHLRTDWSGTWRNGTTNGWQTSSLPTNMPLLADVPSADLPGQPSAGHDGRGRNVLYADGRVEFLPVQTPPDEDVVFLPRGDSYVAADLGTPVVFVGRR